MALDQPYDLALHLVESLQAARIRQALALFAQVALEAPPLPHAVGGPPAVVADDIQARFPSRPSASRSVDGSETLPGGEPAPSRAGARVIGGQSLRFRFERP